MKTNIQDVYAAVGAVVCTAQIFEFTFVMAVKLVLRQPEVSTLEEVAPIQLVKAMRQPVSAILKELSGDVSFDPELTTRIINWIEVRHHIVHRQLLNGGWPDGSNNEDMQAFIKKCFAAVTEGVFLVNTLYPMLVEWLSRFPEFEADLVTLRHMTPASISTLAQRPDYSQHR